MNVITKLAVRSLTSHKGRSAVIGTAVILTAVLFMTVLCIACDIFSASQLSLMLAAGSDFHSGISCRNFTVSEEELLETIRSRPEVKEAYLLTDGTGLVTANGTTSGVRLCSVSGGGILPHLFCKITEGKFPTSESEIALNRLFFPDAEIGGRVSVAVDGFSVSRSEGSFAFSEDGELLTENAEKEFTVSALYTSEADPGAQTACMILYDRAFIPETQIGSVFLCYANTLNLIGKHDALTEELSAYIAAGGSAYVDLNSAYLSAHEDLLNPANLLLVLFSVAVIFFCAFFLIYNIYSISLTQEMAAYGLLGVVGTTYRQLRSVLLRQTSILYGIFAPAGLLLGYFLGWKLIAPLFMRLSGENLNYRFNGWILPISAALTLFTLLYSALRPLRRIRKLSPIESLNGGGDLSIKPVRQTKRITPFVLAGRFAVRNPRRTAVAALSTSLSVLILILVSSLVGLVKYVGTDEMNLHDILLTTYQEERMISNGTGQASTVKIRTHVGDAHNLISPELLSEIRDIPGIREASPVWIAEGDVAVSASVRDRAKEYCAELSEIYEKSEEAGMDSSAGRLRQIADGTMHAVFLSIPDEWVGELRIGGREKYTGSGLTDGTHILSLENYNSVSLMTEEGFRLELLTGIFADGDPVQSEALSHAYTAVVPESEHPYAAIRPLLDYVSWENLVQLFVMPESVFLQEFDEYGMFSILCSFSDPAESDSLTLTEADREYRRQVEAIAEKYRSEDKGVSYFVRVSGRFDGLEELQNRLLAIRVTGYSFCAVIFIIGLMNRINSALSSVIERRQEYAVLEAVGMTERQMRQMMLTENLRSGGIAGSITAAAGIPLITVLLRAAMKEPVPVAWLSGCIMLAVCIAVSVLAGLAAHRLTESAPVVERIKED